MAISSVVAPDSAAQSPLVELAKKTRASALHLGTVPTEVRNRALEAISSDPDPPVAMVPVEEIPVVPDVTAETEPVTPVATEKKTRKSATAAAVEKTDDTP